MRINNFWKFIVAVGVSEFAGIVGSFFTLPSISTWYTGLIKPVLTPPSWVFGPAWTILFLLMGIAAFLVWKNEPAGKGVKIALGIFIIQLIFNTLWSIIFFRLHNVGAAFFELIILWIAIFATIVVFSKVSRPAAFLLVPYILWVSFAGYLNYSIWALAKQGVAPLQSGITGKVLLGPTCPVERIPPEPQCADKPYQTTLVLVMSDGSVVKTFASDAQGNFRVQIAPGEYAIRPAPGASMLPRCGSIAAHVDAGTYTSLTVYCDTGIR